MKHVWEILNSENCEIEWENGDIEWSGQTPTTHYPCLLAISQLLSFVRSIKWRAWTKCTIIHSGLHKSLNYYFCFWFARENVQKAKWMKITQPRLSSFTTLNDLHGAWDMMLIFLHIYFLCRCSYVLFVHIFFFFIFFFIFLDVPLPSNESGGVVY